MDMTPIAMAYVRRIQREEIALEDVPEKIRSLVQELLEK